jgi:hypothetical protein
MSSLSRIGGTFLSRFDFYLCYIPIQKRYNAATLTNVAQDSILAQANLESWATDCVSGDHLLIIIFLVAVKSPLWIT